jgi:hypothetical protein
MSGIKLRAAMLGLLAVVLAGSAMAASASAEPGPFWYHKLSGEKEGTKLAAGVAESFSGEGGEQILSGKAGETLEITSKSVNVKGAITNGTLQGQIKLELAYVEPKIKSPKSFETSCSVTVGSNNTVTVKGHLMWKWNGEKKQLEEQPQANQTWDMGFTAVEPEAQKPFVEKLSLTKVGTFTTLEFKPNKANGCGIIPTNTPVAVSGSEVGIPNKETLGEFNKELTVRTMASEKDTFLQHIATGEAKPDEFQGLELGLSFDGNPASLTGQTTIKPAQQEIAVKEK